MPEVQRGLCCPWRAGEGRVVRWVLIRERNALGEVGHHTTTPHSCEEPLWPVAQVRLLQPRGGERLPGWHTAVRGGAENGPFPRGHLL